MRLTAKGSESAVRMEKPIHERRMCVARFNREESAGVTIYKAYTGQGATPSGGRGARSAWCQIWPFSPGLPPP